MKTDHGLKKTYSIFKTIFNNDNKKCFSKSAY